MNELESFVQLKFYPPQCTIEYVRGIPLEVRRQVVIKNNFCPTDITTASEAVVSFYFGTCIHQKWDDEGVDKSEPYIFWPSLRNALVEYYSNEQRT